MSMDHDPDPAVLVCKNAVCTLFKVGRRLWTKIDEEAAIPDKSAKSKNIEGNKRGKTKSKNEIIRFTRAVGDLDGEPYATMLIRELTSISIRDEEKGILELPPLYTKRKLYEWYCYENGWIAKSDNRGNYASWIFLHLCLMMIT